MGATHISYRKRIFLNGKLISAKVKKLKWKDRTLQTIRAVLFDSIEDSVNRYCEKKGLRYFDPKKAQIHRAA